MDLFLKGLALGFLVAAPVGPIGLLCIRRTLAQSRLHGFLTGLGAATADAAYSVVAAFGLTAVSSFLLGYQNTLRLWGGLFLLVLGARIAIAKAGHQNIDAVRAPLGKTYSSALALTITNPATILSFAAAFAGLGLSADEGIFKAVLMVLGVFLGSAAWWMLLSSLTSLIRKRLDASSVRLVNIGSGMMIAGFGILALYSAAGGALSPGVESAILPPAAVKAEGEPAHGAKKPNRRDTRSHR